MRVSIKRTSFLFWVFSCVFVCCMISNDSLAQSQNGAAKDWNYDDKDNLTKYQKKALKQRNKADREKHKVADKMKSHNKPSFHQQMKSQEKVKKFRAKEQGYIYKDRSKQHIKSQGRKTRKRMKKSLKQHKKQKH